MGWDSPTPEWIWSVSPLDYAAADRILRTSGIPLAVSGSEYDALCTTFAAVALMAVDFLVEPQAPAAAVLEFGRSASSLMQASVTLMNFPGGPPPLPASWIREYANWLEDLIAKKAEEGEIPKKKGAPQKAINQFLYPYLLGVYVVAYDRSPATTIGGPTERFLGAFLETLTKVMRTVKWGGDPAVISTMPDMAAPFVRPTSAALCKRIRGFVDAGDILTEHIRLMVLQFALQPAGRIGPH